jgi:hypothetical protein
MVTPWVDAAGAAVVGLVDFVAVVFDDDPHAAATSRAAGISAAPTSRR